MSRSSRADAVVCCAGCGTEYASAASLRRHQNDPYYSTVCGVNTLFGKVERRIDEYHSSMSLGRYYCTLEHYTLRLCNHWKLPVQVHPGPMRMGSFRSYTSPGPAVAVVPKWIPELLRALCTDYEKLHYAHSKSSPILYARPSDWYRGDVRNVFLEMERVIAALQKVDASTVQAIFLLQGSHGVLELVNGSAP